MVQKGEGEEIGDIGAQMDYQRWLCFVMFHFLIRRQGRMVRVDLSKHKLKHKAVILNAKH